MKSFSFSASTLARQALTYILFGACFLIFMMVALGGATRLTGSGLSIVEWRLVSGIFPPLTLQDWQALFENYQHSPEYLKVNRGMTLEAFKSIFWLEYVHRLWGRLIGLYFLIPLFLSWRVLSLRKRYFFPLVVIFLLGGLQGLTGWAMVKSGLIDDPHVSPYRLAAHLMLALLTYAMTLSIAVRLCLEERKNSVGSTLSSAIPPVALPALPWVLCLLILTIFYGALVAGHKAGLVYNTFPLMGGRWIPEEAWFYKPWLLNLFVNPVMVQWMHRVLASATVLCLGAMIKSAWAKPLASFQRRSLAATGLLALVQMSLGIATLLYQAPIFLALLHQSGGLVLFTALLVTREASKRALTPGSVLPSSHSRKAPPAVER